MLRSFVRIAAVAVMLSSAGASTLPPDLARAAKEFDEAQMHNDGKALQRLLADDYLLANGHGGIENKAQFIADYMAPGFHLDPYVVREPIERVWNDGAVLGGVVTFSGTDGGKRFQVELRFADVWAKRNGKWQVMYTGAIHLPAKP